MTEAEEIVRLKGEVEQLQAALKDALTLAGVWDNDHPILERARCALEGK